MTPEILTIEALKWDLIGIIFGIKRRFSSQSKREKVLPHKSWHQYPSTVTVPFERTQPENHHEQCALCPLRWPQTSTRCSQTKATCWSTGGSLRSKVKGRWRPTSWTKGRPAASGRGGSSSDDEGTSPASETRRHAARTHGVAERLKKLETPSLEWIPSTEGRAGGGNEINF